MSAHNQPPPQAVADLPVAATVIDAFASVAGQLGLVAQAAKGGIVLVIAAALLSLVLPTGSSGFFLIIASFAATSHFGLNWCRVMLLGPAGLPASGLSWREPHWRFFAYGLLMFLVLMLSTLPMTAIASVLAGVIGLSTDPGDIGLRLVLVLVMVCLGMAYVLARLGFIFPAVAAGESYSLRLAWQHTAGQGLRLTAALCAAGFPLALVQFLLAELFTQSLHGVSLTELMMSMPEPGSGPGAEPPSAAEMVDAEPPSVVALLVVDLVAAIFNFLSFAVLFSLLSLAFRTCTGWVPATPGGIPATTED